MTSRHGEDRLVDFCPVPGYGGGHSHIQIARGGLYPSCCKVHHGKGDFSGDIVVIRKGEHCLRAMSKCI